MVARSGQDIVAGVWSCVAPAIAAMIDCPAVFFCGLRSYKDLVLNIQLDSECLFLQSVDWIT